MGAAPDPDRATRITQGPRPVWVRVLIGYFVLFGFLAALLVMVLPLLDAEFAGPYPDLGIPILMLNALALLITGILLLNTAKGWWVAIAVTAIALLEELVRWAALLAGAAVVQWTPWWLLAEDVSVIRTLIALAAVAVAWHPDVRAFYGIGRSEVPVADAERAATRDVPRPSWMGLLVVFFLVIGGIFLLAAFAVGQTDALGATFLLVLVALLYLATGILLIQKAAGWWLAVFHGATGVLGSIGGMVVALDGIALSGLPAWTRGLADGWFLGLVVNVLVLAILIRPSVTAYYGIGQRGDAPPEAD